jgi:NAD(P)-dependent dehydrogenase (short-subunit alcohol dehydrogenase family)
MSDRLAGRAALVTGGGNGIGCAIATRFVRDGASVVVADIEEDSAERVAAELSAFGAATAVRVDISRRDDVRRAVEACVHAYGGLDVLAANAANADVVHLLDIEEAAWRRMLDVNLTGTFLSIQEGARVMRERGGGSIVVTASTNSFWVEANTAHYSATKFGVIGLVRTAALDLAEYGIRVNAVSPGIVKTRLARFLVEDPVAGPEFLKHVPLGRFAEPADVANAVAFLASDEAAYITGENLVVDGGTTVGVPMEPPDEPLPGATR